MKKVLFCLLTLLACNSSHSFEYQQRRKKHSTLITIAVVGTIALAATLNSVLNRPRLLQECTQITIPTCGTQCSNTFFLNSCPEQNSALKAVITQLCTNEPLPEINISSATCPQHCYTPKSLEDKLRDACNVKKRT